MKKAMMLLIVSVSLLRADGIVEKAFLVKGATVKKGYIASYLHYFGKLKAEREAYVITPMVGKLIKYTVKEGENVEKDQVIALLDRDIPGVKTEPVKVKSPIKGTVGILYYDVGQIVTQKQPVAFMYGGRKVLEVSLPGQYLHQLKLGARAFAEYNKTIYKGSIISVSTAQDPISGMGNVKIALNGHNASLTVGMLLPVKITVKSKNNVLLVPQAAIVGREQKTYVFVLDKGRAEEISVKTGIQGDKKIEVSGNIEPGDTVITVGAEGLYNNAHIEIEGQVK